PTVIVFSDNIDGPKRVEPMLNGWVTTWVSPLGCLSAASSCTLGAEMSAMFIPTSEARDAAIDVFASSTSQAAVSGSSFTDLRNRFSTSPIGTTAINNRPRGKGMQTRFAPDWPNFWN